MSAIGFLIVTRPLFVSSLADFIQWKTDQGFNVYVKTAEEIETVYTGSDIRIKIRNCIRDYYYTNNAKYALLIGDSVDVPYPEGPDGPPPPSLSTPWNLPAGYYRADGLVNNQPVTQTCYTTLFYADLSDTVHITSGYSFPGNYKIYVGVVPVRTPGELTNVLQKTISFQCTDQATFVYSEDFYDATYAQKTYQQIQAIVGGSLTLSQFLFGLTSTDDEVYAALFNQPGILISSGHGLMKPGDPNQQPGFNIGKTWISAKDVSKFQYLNPLYLATSCWGDAFEYGESIMEAFLKAEKGPVTMISKAPISYFASQDGGLTGTEKGFWNYIAKGYSFGQAFYDNCNNIYLDPYSFFGDPSVGNAQEKGNSTKPTPDWAHIILSVWSLIVGALLITPQGIFCIKCGVPSGVAGYIGDTMVTILAVGLLALGLYGIVSGFRSARGMKDG